MEYQVEILQFQSAFNFLIERRKIPFTGIR